MSGRPDLKRFGDIVRRRREQLGRQQEDMHNYGGPSSTTMSKIENGASLPAPSTLRKLDAGLRWEPGSARDTLNGGHPQEVERPLNLRDVHTDVLLGEVRRRIVGDVPPLSRHRVDDGVDEWPAEWVPSQQ